MELAPIGIHFCEKIFSCSFHHQFLFLSSFKKSYKYRVWQGEKQEKVILSIGKQWLLNCSRLKRGWSEVKLEGERNKYFIYVL